MAESCMRAAEGGLIQMIIDIHTHITDPADSKMVRALNREPFTDRAILKRMDMEGIERSVLLPIVNPENADTYGVAGNRSCREAVRRHPDRLMTFVNIDPRGFLNNPGADFSRLIRIHKDMGCIGIGEICASLPITDPRYKNLFYHAGEEKMPCLFHFSARKRGVYGILDKPGLTGLEEVLKEFPKTIFIGHAPAFWNEIDGDLKSNPKIRDSYVSGPIKKKGRLWSLFAKYSNLTADLSAGSAYNAMSRDPGVTLKFLKRFYKQIFFGTDRFTSISEPVPPIIAFIKEALASKHLTRREYTAIMGGNFKRMF